MTTLIKPKRLVQKASNWAKDALFANVHGNHLIYNTCWEDPICDRNLLHLDAQSEVVMITSAGCNALDYALDKPKVIHCVDVNYRQNALLELKKAFFKQGNPQALFQFFGLGQHPTAQRFYRQQLRPHLSPAAQQFWDKKIHPYFTANRLRPSFYFHGTSGTFAYLFYRYLKLRKPVDHWVQELLNAPNLAIQSYWYHLIEAKVIGKFVQWAIQQPLTLSLLGIPRAQARLVEEEYAGGIVAFVKDALRYIFTELPIQDNYFWRLYITGQYTRTCCPNYLKAAHFETLQTQEHKIQTHTTTISQFLQKHPNSYSHYVLLDHQDWLAAHDVAALNEEWQLILKNSQPGTKILLRSGATKVDFFPDFVQERVCFEQIDTSLQHRLDRVGTYGSVYCGVVR